MTALTKLQIAALRKCDRVCFHTLPDSGSKITAIKQKSASERDPFAQDIEMEIDVAARVADYAEGDARLTYDARRDCRVTAFESTGRYDEIFETIAGLLREGDELTLIWNRDCSRTQALAETTFHGDRLDLEIKRGEKKLTFTLHTSICEDNSARMVRVSYRDTRAAEKAAA